MDTEFKIGEIVVCINAKKNWYRLGGLKENEMYTVTGFNPYDGGLILKEVKSPSSGCHAYACHRFRKVDYNFSECILNQIKEFESGLSVAQGLKNNRATHLNLKTLIIKLC